MVSVLSVLGGCHSDQLLASLFGNELPGHVFCLFMYSLSPGEWEALIPQLKPVMVRGGTQWMSLSLEVREVIGAGLVSWHVLTASQLAGAGKVARTESLGKRRKYSWDLAAPMKLQEVSTSSLSTREICQPFTTRVRNRTHGAEVFSGEQVERTLMFG